MVMHSSLHLYRHYVPLPTNAFEMSHKSPFFSAGAFQLFFGADAMMLLTSTTTHDIVCNFRPGVSPRSVCGIHPLGALLTALELLLEVSAERFLVGGCGQ